jgi:tRNA pseudouridine38-40 synthase
MRCFFEVSYNGTKYNGWQSQPNATGIQAVIEDSLSKVLRASISITASGRTDTGVHCEQQFFHADLPDTADIERLVFQLNSILPADIAIPSIRPVAPDAHARFDAISRSYKYRIVMRKNPFTPGFAWFYFKPLDLRTMNQAAALLAGKHDFECFSKVKTDVSNFICDISEARWEQHGDRLEFTITANRFLRGMVRAIVGTLIDVGSGRTSLEEFRHILESRDRREAGQNVPPSGLYLVSVIYPSRIFLTEENLKA